MTALEPNRPFSGDADTALMEDRIRNDVCIGQPDEHHGSTDETAIETPVASSSKSPYYFDKGLRKVYPYKYIISTS